MCRKWRVISHFPLLLYLMYINIKIYNDIQYCKMGRTKGSGKKKNYLDNEELKAEMLNCKESKVVSDKLARMFQLIVDNVARSFYWANPDDGEDCKANAVYELCKNFWKYDPENGNAFAFCSQIAYLGIAGTWRILKPKKYDGTISLTCVDVKNNNFDMYKI